MKKERTDSLEYIAKKHKQEQEEYLKAGVVKLEYVGKATTMKIIIYGSQYGQCTGRRPWRIWSWPDG